MKKITFEKNTEIEKNYGYLAEHLVKVLKKLLPDCNIVDNTDVCVARISIFHNQDKDVLYKIIQSIINLNKMSNGYDYFTNIIENYHKLPDYLYVTSVDIDDNLRLAKTITIEVEL